MIIPLYKVIPCCKTNCYDIPEFVHQTNFVQIYTKDKQEGVSKGKENSENTKAARHMQGTSGPRDSGLHRLSGKEFINETLFLRAVYRNFLG